MDVFSKEKRSDIMSRVGSKNTKPERIVRSILHNAGYRYRLHRRDLPGSPDVVLPKHKRVIYVHGCFWHGHKGCPRSKRPNSNVDFWEKKLDGNIQRDRINLRRISEMGWSALIIWSCEIRNREELLDKLLHFMSESR